MRIQSKFFIGLLYLIIVKIRNTFSEPVCEVTKLSANCVRRGFTDIPQRLDMNIEALDVSFNPIEELREDDFKRYPKLVVLRLHGITLPSKAEIIFQPYVFTHLKNLEKLDISESAFNIWYKNIVWPEKLTHLNVGALTNAKFFALNLTTLYQLGDLNASHNQIENFPILHPEAPIYFIDIFDNPLKNVTAEHLAPYCLLRYFHIRVTKLGLLNTPPFHCQCRRLEQWMLKNKIDGFKFSCHVPLSSQIDDCPVKNFSDEMYKQRNACIDRQPTHKFWKLLLIILGISLLAPVAYSVVLIYKYQKKMKGSSNIDSSADDNFASDDTAPSNAGDASEPSPDS